MLVNSAGIIRDNLIFKMSTTDWDAVMDVHLRGAFLMTRAAQTHMTQAKWGRIVNISSTSALGNRGQANYATAKAGLIGFTKTLALELGKFGVTANAIAPGFVETDMTQATAARQGIDYEDWKLTVARDIPIGSHRDSQRISPPSRASLPGRGWLCLRPGHLRQWRRQELGGAPRSRSDAGSVRSATNRVLGRRGTAGEMRRLGWVASPACERGGCLRDCLANQSESYMLFSTSAYFFSTALRRTFRVGVTSPSSTLNSEGKISNRLMVSQRSRDWLASVI